MIENPLTPHEARIEALRLAVRWTERHTSPEDPRGVVGAARIFEEYLLEVTK